jgi:hypothetical protein
VLGLLKHHPEEISTYCWFQAVELQVFLGL